MNKKKIPQHPLLNKSGQKVRFDIQDWENASSYDFLKAHRHSFHEVLIFEKGKAQHDIDFATFEGKAGHIHFVASENVHLLVREENSKGFSILFTDDYFSKDIIEQLPFYSPQPVIQLDKTSFKSFLQLVNLVKMEFNNTSSLSEKLIHSYSYALMLLLLKSNPNDFQVGNNQTEYIQQFKKLIKENYKQHYTVEKYAELISISPKHLIELCKTQTGKTPLKLIQEHVISEAKRLFYHTKMTVKEVAYELNFDTPASFSKYFKSATGHSPSIYRKEDK
jgi:AraC family transcriptional activator of pobA